MNNAGFLKIKVSSDSERTFFNNNAIPEMFWAAFSKCYEEAFVNDFPPEFEGTYHSLPSALRACLMAANRFEGDNVETAPFESQEFKPHESLCRALGTASESLSALYRWLSEHGTEIEHDPSLEARIDMMSMAPDAGGEGWYYCLKASGEKQSVAVLDLWNDLFADLDDEMGKWLISDLEQSNESDLEEIAREHGKFRELSIGKPDTGPRAGEESNAQRAENRPEWFEKRKALRVGDTFSFGRFSQRDPRKPEPIEWIVLDKKDGRVLLLSKLILASLPFHKAKVTTPWCDSRIREWLNHDFLDIAFDRDERAAIVSTEIDEADSAGVKHMTTDLLFLLSADEEKKYMPKPENRSAKGTRCAGNDYWGLRSYKKGAESFQYYTATGRLGSNSFDELSYFKNFDCTLGVRPAVWIVIE